MPAKRYSVEQIVAKLREAEKHQASGLTIPQACKRLGVSEQTFYRWRIKYGAMKELAAEHPRWGYRMVWSLLRAEGWRVNRKRIMRLWRLEGHRVPARRGQG